MMNNTQSLISLLKVHRHGGNCGTAKSRRKLRHSRATLAGELHIQASPAKGGSKDSIFLYRAYRDPEQNIHNLNCLEKHKTFANQSQLWRREIDAMTRVVSNVRGDLVKTCERMYEHLQKHHSIINAAQDGIMKWQGVAKVAASGTKMGLEEVNNWKQKNYEIRIVSSYYQRRYLAIKMALESCTHATAEFERAAIIENSHHCANLLNRVNFGKNEARGHYQRCCGLLSKVLGLHCRVAMMVKEVDASIAKTQLQEPSREFGCVEGPFSTVNCKLQLGRLLAAPEKEQPTAINANPSSVTSVKFLESGRIAGENNHTSKKATRDIDYCIKTKTRTKLPTSNDLKPPSAQDALLKHKLVALATLSTCWKEERIVLHASANISNLKTSTDAYVGEDTWGVPRQEGFLAISCLSSEMTNLRLTHGLSLRAFFLSIAGVKPEQPPYYNITTLAFAPVASKLAEVASGTHFVMESQAAVMRYANSKARTRTSTQDHWHLVRRYVSTSCLHIAQLGGTYLTRLDLSFTQLHDHSISPLVRLLANSTAPAYYTETLGTKQLPQTSHACGLHNFLSHVVLCKNALGDVAASVLASDFLPMTMVLFVLDLRQNQISAIGGHLLKVGVQKNQTVLNSFIWRGVFDRMQYQVNDMIVCGCRGNKLTIREALDHLDQLPGTFGVVRYPQVRLERTFVPCVIPNQNIFGASLAPLLVDVRNNKILLKILAQKVWV